MWHGKTSHFGVGLITHINILKRNAKDNSMNAGRERDCRESIECHRCVGREHRVDAEEQQVWERGKINHHLALWMEFSDDIFKQERRTLDEESRAWMV